MKRIVMINENATKHIKIEHGSLGKESIPSLSPSSSMVFSRPKTSQIKDRIYEPPYTSLDIDKPKEGAEQEEYKDIGAIIEIMNTVDCPSYLNLSLLEDYVLDKEQTIKLLDAIANNKSKIKHLEFGNIAIDASYGDDLFAICKDFTQLTINAWKLFIANNQQAIIDLEEKFKSIMPEDRPKKEKFISPKSVIYRCHTI